jgi:tetratricopeptide (TPR) repeat protein
MPFEEIATLAPLEAIPSRIALETKNRNAGGNWPSRGVGVNRVEPIATPIFRPEFQLNRGEKVFTMGSCFARNVEVELERAGFVLPVLEFYRNEGQAAGFSLSELDLYGTPSIYNELAWALDPNTPFEPEVNLFEVSPGKFIDIHLPKGFLPAALSTVKKRREMLSRCVATVAQCSVVVITLGLAEVWWDNEAQHYLNTLPHLRVLKAYPDRFELHALSVDQARAYLFKALALLEKHCPKDLRVLVTVSPVPLGATFRNKDIMVANTYSKAVMRVVAEEACQKFNFVHYYPSYETVILSARTEAFEDDQRHIRPSIVKVAVSRMVAAYVGQDGYSEVKEATQADFALVRGELDAAPNFTSRVGLKILEKHFDVIRQSPDLLHLYGVYATNCGDLDRAAAAAHGLPQDWAPHHRLMLQARISQAATGPAAALDLLDQVEEKERARREYWRLRLHVLIQLQRFDEARAAASNWASMDIVRVDPFFDLAVGLIKSGRREQALPLLEQAHLIDVSEPRVLLELVEVLMNMGQLDRARELAPLIQPESDRTKIRLERLRHFL